MSENELVEIRFKSLEIYLQYVRYRTSHHPYTLEEIVEQAKKIEKVQQEVSFTDALSSLKNKFKA